MEPITTDHIVVGAGINGSWAALQLARRGAKVLLLEKFPLPHSRGSSHGQTRGIRKAYPDKLFTRLMEEAYRAWEELEHITGIQLIKTTGLLCFSDEPDNPFLTGVIESFRSNSGTDYETFNPDQMRTRFPYLSLGADGEGCLDPLGGIIMADKALRAVQDLAVGLGVSIHDGDEVVHVEHSVQSVTVSTDSGARYQAKSCVICAGPWAGPLLKKIGCHLPLTPMKIPVYYWQVEDFLPHTFIYEGKTQLNVWGLPPHEYPGLAKICLHKGPPTDPDSRDSVDTRYMKEQLQEFIRSHFPGVVAEVQVEESCLYTVTPDWNPVIDVMPGVSNVVIAAGFSGTGFKMGPVTGRMLADLAQGLCTRQEEPLLAIDRFL